MFRRGSIAALALVLATHLAHAGDGNRLTYLDEPANPYYVHRNFPKLTTPTWVGEEGVEAVVILAIDDMRGHEKWEAYLRPILERLKKIDGRAPLSIMTCSIDPNQQHLQTWLKEGVSLECHTVDHPCPLLRDGDFAKAKGTYDRCVDLMSSIPNNRPVAFRTPCCDSLNTNSPRMYAEILNKSTPTPNPSPEAGEGNKPASPPSLRFGERGAGGRGVGGNFLQIDSSVFNVFTSNDPALPRELVLDADGRERFRKYLPRDRSFVNYVEDYPYPYVIGRLCWEFPCMTPSDWQAQHLHKPNNPITVRDWQAALDCTVIKQGVFCLVFHPHGWITNEQIIQLIDHAVTRHGKKVKFLTFKEALERLNKNLLGGQALRDDRGGDGHRVCLLDVNNDGYMDVVTSHPKTPQCRVWSPKTKGWLRTSFPDTPVGVGLGDYGAFFGVFRADGLASFLYRTELEEGAWHFDGKSWVEDKQFFRGLENRGQPTWTAGLIGEDFGVRLRDLDRDGLCEVITRDAVFKWSPEKKSWLKLPFAFPPGAAFVDTEGWDLGLRFIDLNEDGNDDIVFSNEERYGIWLCESMEKGWSRKVVEGVRGDKPRGSSIEIPPITVKGANNGFFVHSRHLWWQNEHTNLLKDHMDRRSFAELLKDVEPGPKSPEASLQCIQTRPGFTVELVAAEPLVQDPIAFAFGPDGKLWVVEMGDYPLGVDGKGKPSGRVRFLQDTDGDGRYDRSTVFLENLGYPTGVLPWRKGVLVTCAPDIFYAEDTDGDGKADKREVILTGFKEGNPQHRVNGLVWGLDGWVYGANGDSGGMITRPSPPLAKGGLAPINISGRDFRFKPDTGGFEAVTGQTQYGRCRDDWGNWFGGNNANPLWHFVLEDRYLKRNPHFAPPNPRVDVPVTPGQAPVYPISRTLPRFNDFHTANRFTSACSPTFYRDDLFGPHFANDVFICEPVHNLVSRLVLTPEGVMFKGRRAPGEEQAEFLASSDNWFRPVFAQTGPDGALWIADMYRHVIEHPEWIPKETQKKLDLRAGHDKGRIYRVYPVDKKPKLIPRLDKLDTAGLVAALDSPNGWQRDMAMMMLVWKNDKEAVRLLVDLIGKADRPATRLQALCTVDVMSDLTDRSLTRALSDKHPAVRRHAIRLCESSQSVRLPLSDALGKLVEDPDPWVRLQLAYTLGQSDSLQAREALGQLAVRAAGDRYLTAAVMSSLNAKNIEPVLLAVLAKGRSDGRLLESLLHAADALGNKRALTIVLQAISVPEKGKYAIWQYAALGSLLDSLEQRRSSLAQLEREADPELKKAIAKLPPLFEEASGLACVPQTEEALRLVCIPLVGKGAKARIDDIKDLAVIASAYYSTEVQNAALEAIARSGHPETVQLLMFEWVTKTPSLRSRVLNVILRRDEWTLAALSNLEQQRLHLRPTDFDAATRQRLLDHEKPEIRACASKLFAGNVDKNRQNVIASYKAALTSKGDRLKGQPLFVKHCSTCHKLAGVGSDVGPDLAAMKDKSPQALLEAILDPSRAVEARYMSYLLTTQNGLTFTGLLSNETSNSITLVGTDGKPQTILRSNLERLISIGKSAMPDGLEKDVNPEQMADLLAFLTSSLPQPKRKDFVGNQPELVKPAADGSLKLTAKNCEIYGTSLVFEAQFTNLGWWTKEDDHAVWTIDVPKAGKYEVHLDYASHDSAASDTFVLTIGEQRLTGKVAGTGTWENYRQLKVGEVELVAGQQRAIFRSVGPIRSALIDLRAVRLAPAK